MVETGEIVRSHNPDKPVGPVAGLQLGQHINCIRQIELRFEIENPHTRMSGGHGACRGEAGGEISMARL